MKNPLRKRLLRELKNDIGKYLVIFLFMTATIGFVSGFLVADESMLYAYDESFEKYNVENGNFTTEQKLTDNQRTRLEKEKVTIYENFYKDEDADTDLDSEPESTIRLFKNRTEVNLVCLMKGEMPQQKDEIAIDRMYADNNDLQVGDVISVDKKELTVTGLVALSDYSALFSNSSDMMFDAVKFGVGIMTEEGYDAITDDHIKYCYSWKYDTEPKDENEEKEWSDDFVEVLAAHSSLTGYLPRYGNQAIKFTGDDMGGDKVMVEVLLYILIAIMAFIFAVTTNNTIVKEASVIGTLRASGYTRRELLLHYLSLPVLITILSAVIGNILGYTVFKDICAGMYYGSYSLPTYVTIWNAEAFLLTTVVPVVIMFVVNYAILHHKLKLSPLKFLRRDLSTRKQKRALYLSPKLKIFHRFRLRVIFQNISNYLVLFVGIVFANLLLMFGLLLPSALDHYQMEIQNNMLAKYQYMLSVPVSVMGGSNKLESMLDMLLFSRDTETDNEDAEEFSAYSLNTLPGKYKSEEVSLYGIHDDSKYIDADFSDGVYISQAYADKFLLKPGDTITLKEKYEDDEYTFGIGGIYDYNGGLCIFMPQDELNQMFDLGDDYFSGYFSNSEITDIDSSYIGSVIDLDALTKISRQLNVSMGSMMGLVNGFAIAIYMILIYLLSKIIIEKNAQSISMTKILGYTNGEISRLYIMSTSIVVILCLLISLPIEATVMEVLFREMMLQSISGWIALWIDPMIYVQMFAAGFVTYGIVALLEYRRIRKVPMGEALKNAE